MRITLSATSKVLPAQAVGAATFAGMLLAGCGMNGALGTGGGTGGTTPLAVYQGKVFGGQQPVNGATIQLYTVGTTGTATASTALISSTVMSNNGGQFSLSPGNVPLYSCTSATQVYIAATGGDAGSGPNANLSADGGPRPLQRADDGDFININELTTVAAVYALAPFMTNVTPLVRPATILLDWCMLSRPPIFSSARPLELRQRLLRDDLPTTEMNTLADILAACVNSTGAGTAGCNAVFRSDRGIGHHCRWTRHRQEPGERRKHRAVVVASGGFTLQSEAHCAAQSTLRWRSATQAAELASPYGVAIDVSGSAWVTNEAGRSVVKLPSLSTTFATTTYSNGGLLAPRGISIEAIRN